MKWRAWYATSRTTWVVYSSAETSWQEIPPGNPDGPEGLVGVVEYHEPPYRTILDAADWYYLKDGKLQIVRNALEWGQWAPRPDVECASCVKQSGAMDDASFEAVQAEMMEARTWP